MKLVQEISMNATNGAASQNGDATGFPNIAAVKFDPLAAMQVWQRSTARFSRANVELMHGLTAATKMQVELGQELMQRQFSALKQFSLGAKPATILNGQIAKTSEEADHLVTTVRKISDEIRLSFTQATRMLFEAEAPEADGSAVVAARKADSTPARKTANIAEART
jgi:TRAP-type mannitol/chloroaromatic compound transport system permease large subunit